MPPAPQEPNDFCYDGYTIDPARGEVHCTYSTGGYSFTERYLFGPEGDWERPGRRGRRAHPVPHGRRVVLQDHGGPGHRPRTHRDDAERTLLPRRSTSCTVLASSPIATTLTWTMLSIGRARSDRSAAAAYAPSGPVRPLIPFGGGIDSIVTVSALREGAADAALCIVHPPGDRFAAIEDAAAVTGLPVDPHRPRDRSPGAALRKDSASSTAMCPLPPSSRRPPSSRPYSTGATPSCCRTNGRPRHPPSCTRDARSITNGPKASSSKRASPTWCVTLARARDRRSSPILRSRSELWVAQQFAQLKEFHGVFRSCNRAFHQNPAERLGQWCGTCDKCCFIDLILSPFMDAADLEEHLRRPRAVGQSPTGETASSRCSGWHPTRGPSSAWAMWASAVPRSVWPRPRPDRQGECLCSSHCALPSSRSQLELSRRDRAPVAHRIPFHSRALCPP